jgi:hypothetical protein
MIDWKAIKDERIKEAALYGEEVAKRIESGDDQMAFYHAMHAAHMALLAFPELGE